MKCLTCGGQRLESTYAEKLDDGVFLCRDCRDVFTASEARLTAERNAQRDIIRRLRDICHWLTPELVYSLLGDDAVSALGWPLRISDYKGDTAALIDLSWTEMNEERSEL